MSFPDDALEDAKRYGLLQVTSDDELPFLDDAVDQSLPFAVPGALDLVGKFVRSVCLQVVPIYTILIILFVEMPHFHDEEHDEWNTAMFVVRMFVFGLFPFVSVTIIILRCLEMISREWLYYALMRNKLVMVYHNRSLHKTVLLYFFLLSGGAAVYLTLQFVKQENKVQTIVLVVMQFLLLISVYYNVLNRAQTGLVTINEFLHQTNSLDISVSYLQDFTLVSEKSTQMACIHLTKEYDRQARQAFRCYCFTGMLLSLMGVDYICNCCCDERVGRKVQMGGLLDIKGLIERNTEAFNKPNVCQPTSRWLWAYRFFRCQHLFHGFNHRRVYSMLTFAGVIFFYALVITQSMLSLFIFQDYFSVL